MGRPDSKRAGLERFTSGVPGLDLLCGAGPYAGGIYLVLGRPGVGKTILGNQMCFAHVKSGHRAVFITLLTEAHARMLNHLRVFDFFDPSQVGKSLHYISGYEALEKEKLPGLLDTIRVVLRQHQATLLVIDGLVTAGSIAESDLGLKKFIHEMQSLVELVGCTAFLLTGARDAADQYPIRTMVDGLIELTAETVEMGIVRSLEVLKLRGGAFLMGQHRMEITDAGLTVFPRIESYLGRDPRRPALASPPLSFGVPRLDEMMGGGARRSGVTMLLGASGSGKTVLGLSFLLAGARHDERGLYLGFSESPAELEANSRGLGPGLARHLKSHQLELVWHPLDDALIPDALAAKVLEAVEERRVRRVFIDGVSGLQTPGQPARTRRFSSALCNELRRRGVTTVLSEESRDIVGPEIALPTSGLAGLADNIILLRHVELNAKLRRLISVVKLRGKQPDPSLREFSIGPKGVELAATFDSAEAILTGIARERAGLVQAPARPHGKARGRSGP